jgi:hypothetical protein
VKYVGDLAAGVRSEPASFALCHIKRERHLRGHIDSFEKYATRERVVKM